MYIYLVSQKPLIDFSVVDGGDMFFKTSSKGGDMFFKISSKTFKFP